MAGFRVIGASREHLPGLLAGYAAAFPDAILPKLSHRVLLGVLRHVIEDARGFGLVAIDNDTGQTVGLAVGGDPHMFRHYYLTRAPLLAGVVLCRMFTSREIRGMVWARLRTLALELHLVRPHRYSRAPTPPKANWAFLYSMFVDPRFHRRGIGKALVKAFEAECDRRGYFKLRLTAQADNKPANQLYLKCGWKLIGRQGNMKYYSTQTRPTPEP
jgi:GNAT superfamily N-acetyltransferase